MFKCLKKIPDVPKEVIEAFLLQRLYIRIKFINHQNQLIKLKKQDERQLNIFVYYNYINKT